MTFSPAEFKCIILVTTQDAPQLNKLRILRKNPLFPVRYVFTRY